MMGKMVEIHVTPRGMGLGGWAVKVNGRRVSWFTVQSNAEACAIFFGQLIGSVGGKATVKAHKANGRIKWERTYPRKTDPKKTKS